MAIPLSFVTIILVMLVTYPIIVTLLILYKRHHGSTHGEHTHTHV